MSLTRLSGDVLAVTDESFEQDVLKHDGPVLVDFWAEWCPSCHMVSAVLAEIAHERAGSLAVRKLNTDENPVIASDYRVMSLPTLILFRDAEPILSLVGARPKSRLLSAVDDTLAR